MKAPFSLYLDGLRLLAAVTVLLSHFAYERFTGGRWLVIRDYNLGSDAVVLFFVLSGLVIAFAAGTKDRTGGAFLFARATRLYSVALPAVLATLLMDRLGAALDPAAYDGWWHNPAPVAEQLWYGLTYSGEWLSKGFRLGSNGPWWSLSYEVAYYLIFAAAMFLAGALRIVAILVLCLLAGPRVLLLLPVWLMGVGVWRLIAADRLRMPRNAAALAAGLPVALYVAALGAGVPALLMQLTQNLTGLEPGRVADGFRFSDEFLWNWLLGALASLHLLGVAALLAARRPAPAGRLAGWVRWGAGASFSLYLVHYPALQFFDAALPEPLAWALRDALLLALATGGCLLFAEAFERPLRTFRAAIRRLAAPALARFA